MPSPEHLETQLPAAEFLRDRLGYTYLPGDSRLLAEDRGSESEPWLPNRLLAALLKINPGLSETGAKQAIAALRQPAGMGLMEANEATHRMLTRWVNVEDMERRRQVSRSVKLFDFDKPENNDFLVVTEFSVKGPQQTRRLDLAVFVNGLPLVAVECKRPDDRQGIANAVKDLLTYQDREEGIARFFHTVQLCVALKKNDARYGSILTPLPHYAQWKTTYPHAPQADDTPQNQLLLGMLEKGNLLDLARHFVAFDREGGKVVKKVCRYQQFEAVNKTIARIMEPGATPMNERGGVVWHTQGSGKSLTMLWLSVKLRQTPGLDNPTLLIVTDRKDLDHQITDTFHNCGLENPIRAVRVSHLRRVLGGPQGQTVLTTVQKFRDEIDGDRGSRHPVLTESDRVFVLVDEAHRTEYGKFAAHMRKALPNACLLAFTGTPIPRTGTTFGPYIHAYTMPQSVADGATVPILYESRLPEVAVWGKRLDPIFETEFSHLSAEQRAEVKKQAVQEKVIAESPDRIEAIAADIAQHYRENFEQDGFKAQVAACSQHAALLYHKALQRYFPGRVAMLISDPAHKDDHELWEVRETYDDEKGIIKRFKYEGVDRLAILVVADKYLTGFDAPVERVLYLDKPLREHGLLQAIARVNRVYPEMGKAWGLVVDYWGVAGFLSQALAIFGDALKVDQVMAPRDDDAAVQSLRQKRGDVFALFPAGLNRMEIEPWVLTLENEDHRAVFLARYRAFYKALEQVLPDPRALAFLGDFAWLRRVRMEMQAMYCTEDLEVADGSPRVRALIQSHVKVEDIRVLLAPVPIMSEKFEQELGKLKSTKAKAIRMEHAIRKEITVRLHEDPAFYETIKDRLDRIIQEKRQARMTEVQEFQLFSQLRDALTQGKRNQAQELGIPEEVAPFYGILEKRLPAADVEGKKALGALAQNIVENLVSEAVIDWQAKEEVQREMRQRIKRQLRLAQVPEDALEELTASLLDLARVRIHK